MYIAGGALILHVFVIKHIAASGIDLIGIVNHMMLKWDVSTQNKSLSAVQAVFAGTTKICFNML